MVSNRCSIGSIWTRKAWITGVMMWPTTMAATGPDAATNKLDNPTLASCSFTTSSVIVLTASFAASMKVATGLNASDIGSSCRKDDNTVLQRLESEPKRLAVKAGTQGRSKVTQKTSTAISGQQVGRLAFRLPGCTLCSSHECLPKFCE